MKISFLMAANRDYNAYGCHVVDSIFKISNPLNMEIEILVSSPNVICDDRIKYFSEFPDDDIGKGGDGQYNHLIRYSSGDYIAGITDRKILPHNYFDLITFLESDVFTNRNYKVTSPTSGQTNNYPHPELSPSYGEALSKTPFYFNIPDFRIICHPIMSRCTYEKLGMMYFHPHLRHAANWYLSFYLFKQNEEVLHLDNCWFEDMPVNRANHFDPIMKIYRHEYKFGEFYINLYRLIKHYKEGQPYPYSESEYLSEKEIIDRWFSNIDG